jgi:hypothetical protein
MTVLRGVDRQTAAMLAVMLAGFASLATSSGCTTTVQNEGGADLSTEQTGAVQRYRILAPRGSNVRVEVTLESEAGATVRVALVPDTAALWPSAPALEEAVSIAPGSKGRANVALPRCTAQGCADYGVALELELVEGSEARAEWTARAELDECKVEGEGDEYYFEIRRD